MKCQIASKGRAYHRMIVSERIIDRHVLEEPTDVLVEEAFNLSIIEFRVHEDGTQVRFYYIRETLRRLH